LTTFAFVVVVVVVVFDGFFLQAHVLTTSHVIELMTTRSLVPSTVTRLPGQQYMSRAIHSHVHLGKEDDDDDDDDDNDDDDDDDNDTMMMMIIIMMVTMTTMVVTDHNHIISLCVQMDHE